MTIGARPFVRSITKPEREWSPNVGFLNVSMKRKGQRASMYQEFRGGAGAAVVLRDACRLSPVAAIAIG